MRKLGIALIAALMLPVPGARAEVPLLPRPCAVESVTDSPRPVSCRRILYKYGPLHVTPGDNLILVGPVTIERPLEDGYVVRFKPNLERADGTIPNIEVLHLHHAVWLSTAFADPMFASGEEKTVLSVPNGYGIRTRRSGEAWLLNYMLHNQTALPDNVFITYEIDFIPASAPEATSITPVEPWWMDVAGYNGFNPVYNTQRGYGAATPGECAYPKERCAAFDPYGEVRSGQGQAGNGVGLVVNPPDGTIVFMAGHVHPGGLRTEVEIQRGNARKRVFTSEAVYYDPNGPVSWDMSMEVTLPDYRLRVGPDDRLVLNSVYETRLASWYEGMGIVITYVARGDASGLDPFTATVDPDRTAVTHGHMAEAGNHGGQGRRPLTIGERVDTDTVRIAGFQYAPGNLGTEHLAVPSVERGGTLTFVNLDFGASIYHTVTACAAPCNGGTGISYPLADGAVDFDSLELGFGPPGVTAAANTISFELDTAALALGIYTYFCRVHPSMRGAFEVAPAS